MALQVGDILKTVEKETFPADMVTLLECPLSTPREYREYPSSTERTWRTYRTEHPNQRLRGIQAYNMLWAQTQQVMLGSSEPGCIAYVNTMNLDGETNLKPKTVTRCGRRQACYFARFYGVRFLIVSGGSV
jgi:hypothetical protein